MRESRTYGSVRGALSNGCPYRVSGGASLPSYSAAPAVCRVAVFNGLDEGRNDGQCVLPCTPLSSNQATVWITSLQSLG